MKLFSEETLIHYGIPNQKWGRRRWQNEDGTFNEAGKERYFGKVVNNIKDTLSNLTYNEKKVNKKVEKKLKKDLQNILLNKDKYTEEEFFNKLNKAEALLNIQQNYLSAEKSWIEKYNNTFSNVTANRLANNIGNSMVDFLFGYNN